MALKPQKILKIVLILVGGLVIFWFVLAFFVRSNQEKIKSKLLSELNSQMSGELKLRDFETSLFKRFPAISFTMHDVLLRDSLWKNHQYDLLQAKEIGINLSIWGLITGNTSIKALRIKNAIAYIFTDSNGYSNTQLFSKKAKPTEVQKQGNTPLPFYRIDAENFKVHSISHLKSKAFEFNFAKIKGNFNESKDGWVGKLKIDAHVINLSFNTNRGSFLKDKQVNGQIDLSFNETGNQLNISTKDFIINKDQFEIKAILGLNHLKTDLTLEIIAKGIYYHNIVDLMPLNISTKLKRFSIDKPIDVSATISDLANSEPTTANPTVTYPTATNLSSSNLSSSNPSSSNPLIKVNIVAKNSNVGFPSGNLEQASFDGTFTNQEDINDQSSDENSLIQFKNLKGNYLNIPLVVDTFSIRNLNRPIASGMVRSNFSLSRLNESLDKNLFEFKGGDAQVQIYCKMDMENLEFTKPDFTGTISVKDADVSYIPRKINLINSQFDLTFNQKDMHINNARFYWNKSELKVFAEIKNLLNLYYQAPEKIRADVKIKSNYLSLNELITFLSPRPITVVKKKNSKSNWINQLSKVIEESSIDLDLNVNRAQFKKFLASPVKAELSLLNNRIDLKNIIVGHSGGSLTLTGQILHRSKSNSFNIQSNINRVNVSEFFKAFDNFGQKTLQSKHLTGYLTANVRVNGQINSAGKLNPNTINGKVGFNLDRASLKNFEPLEKIQKFAFKKRDFKNIQFDKLRGNFDLVGDKVYIHPMQINTSVLNFNIDGVYAYQDGTEISVAIPLRNPKKDEGIQDATILENNRMKGVVVKLLAVDDQKGGVKIKWKP